MSPDVLTALAMTGASTIVAAMATNAWQSTRDGVARLFRRPGHDPRVVEAQLEGDASVVAQDEDVDGARQDLVGPWRRRLAALLREHPEAEPELRALVEEIRRQLPAAEQRWLQINTVSGSGTLFATQGGNVIVHGAGPDQARPPAPRSSAADGDPE
ncbi:hypothetical protein Daura_06030 [Dactylosporangium aurantiacum]|uniref:Uncharacterized protein n=1 Tax=Dactylosporangium aurantiacum TaxID=35754 RepID=A0A9Q9ILZ0_9ACTN|nr:hypothetical protein [Dactylosporangium aurantiacum]MDG6108835.1 hypothetical protein [Dactylosporangium aurantiacum]UWZ55759.1 hypothetical protein Daura_06030 [Dactylosporangium aurantiacum]